MATAYTTDNTRKPQPELMEESPQSKPEPMIRRRIYYGSYARRIRCFNLAKRQQTTKG